MWVNIFLPRRQEIGVDGISRAQKLTVNTLKNFAQVWLPPETFSATPVLALSPLPPSSPSPAPPISLPPSHLDCSLPGTAPTSPTIERRFGVSFLCVRRLSPQKRPTKLKPTVYRTIFISVLTFIFQEISALPPLYQHRLCSSLSLASFPVQVNTQVSVSKGLILLQGSYSFAGVLFFCMGLIILQGSYSFLFFCWEKR